MPRSDDKRPRKPAGLSPDFLIARALIKTGYVHKDARLIRNGQALMMKTLATLEDEASPAVQLELPFTEKAGK